MNWLSNYITSASDLHIGASLFLLTYLKTYFSVTARQAEAGKFKEPDTANNVILRLLLSEQLSMLHAPPVSTISFYSGKINACSLKDKVIAIIKANPWLASRLIHSKMDGVVAQYPKELSDFEPYFSFVHDDTIKADVSYEYLSASSMKYVINRGMECINLDQPLFKVCLIEIEKDARYAIIMSLSHVIGDGHTYYSLYAQLDETQDPVALVSERRQDFMKNFVAVTNPKVLQWYLSPTLVIGYLGTLYCRSVPKALCFEVNNASIEHIKSIVKSLGSEHSQFVSTNDIITSWFFRICRHTHGMMTINFRRRFAGFGDDLAGNYQSTLLFDSNTFSHPLLIRQAVDTSVERYSPQFPAVAIPSLIQTLNFNIGCVTNWSSFFKEVKFSSSRLDCHLPLVSMKAIVFRDLLYIFKSNAHTTSVLFMARNVSEKVLLQDEDVLGKHWL